MLVGTASVSREDNPPPVSGTAIANYTAMSGWWAATKRTRARVLINGEDITGLVGDIQISSDTSTLVRTATFTLLDARAAFFAAGSLSYGSQPVEVWLSVDDGSGDQEWCAFRGTTEASSDEDPDVPRAQVRAVSQSAQLANATAGCVELEPFAGHTWKTAIEEYAANNGITLSLGNLPSETIQKALSLSGLSIESLILRAAPLNGWYVREAEDGTLEFKTEDEVVGAPARCVVRRSNYLGSPREDPPNHPVTVLSVGGQQVGLSLTDPTYSIPTDYVSIEEGVDGSGNRWDRTTTVTLWFGIEIRREVREWGMVTPLSYGPTRHELTVSTYGTSDHETGAPNGQLIRQVTETWGNYEIPMYTGAPAQPDGRHVSPLNFLLLSRVTTSNWYNSTTDPNPCFLSMSETVTEGYYSPLTSSIGGCIYDDGSVRAGQAYGFMEIGRTRTLSEDNIAKVEASQTNVRETWSRSEVSAWAVPPGALTLYEVYDVLETTLARRQVVGQPWHIEWTTSAVRSGGWSSSYTRQPSDIPLPERASPATPQFMLTPMTVTLAAWTDIYPIVQRTDNNDDAETPEQLSRIAVRTMRNELGLRVTFHGPLIRSLLPWDVIAVEDDVRDLTTRPGWIERTVLTVSPLNGWLGWEATIVIPPAGVV